MNMHRATFALAMALLPAPGAALAGAQAEQIADEGTIGDRWALAAGATLATPAYPPAFASRGDDVCIALGYTIREDGTTSDFGVLKQWNSDSGDKEPVDGYWKAFAQAGANAVAQWRFKPRPEVQAPRPVRTVATLTFTGPGQGGDVKARCRITDLAGLLQQRQSDELMDRSRDRREMERAQRNQQNAALQDNPGMRPPPGNPANNGQPG